MMRMLFDFRRHVRALIHLGGRGVRQGRKPFQIYDSHNGIPSIMLCIQRFLVQKLYNL